MWVILLLTLLSLYFLYGHWKYSYWSRRGVPSPKPCLFFGNIASAIFYKKALGELVTQWYNDYKNAPYVGIYRCFEPAIVLRDPDLIKDVLIKDFPNFQENDFYLDPKADPLLANNPFGVTGEKWKRSRNMLVPLFTTSKVKAIYSNMEYACKNFVDYLHKQPASKDFEAKELCGKFTAENIVRCGFSLNANSFEDEPSEFQKVGSKVFEPSMLSIFKFMMLPMLPKWIANLISTPIVSKNADNWFRNLVQENRASRENVSFDREDLMQMLMSLGKKMDASDDELAGHALSLFLEGFETSSHAIASVFYELARNPDIQENLYKEITTVLAKNENKYSYEVVQGMSYLNCVIQETLRLDAVSMLMLKVCTKEYTLPRFGNQKEGVKVYPGTTIYIPVHGLQLDPNNYTDPMIFRPERFENEERNNRHKALYLPFGEGPRMCMGMRLALAQVKAATIAVIQEFKVTISPNHKPFEVNPTSFMYQSKHGLLLNFSPRSKS